MRYMKSNAVSGLSNCQRLIIHQGLRQQNLIHVYHQYIKSSFQDVLELVEIM